MATLAAWERFVASVPEAQREYRTLEIWHPDLSQAYRFVDNSLDVAFTLEAAAPRNAGQSVTFVGVTLQITEPADRQDAEQTLTVRFGNTDGTMQGIIDQISDAGYFTPVQVVYRKYYSGDLSAPAVPPLYLFATSLGFDGPTSAAFGAEDIDLSQKRSGALYTLEDYPGLRD